MGQTLPFPASPRAYLRAGLSARGYLGDWYADVREGCEVFSARHGIPLETVAGVLATTSPRVHVRKNMELARRVLLFGSKPESLLPSAWAATAHFLETGEIRGPKTSAFARAILGDREAIVVDVWVARALGIDGQRLAGRRYSDAADTVRALARCEGIAPREAQAALWYGARRAWGRYDGGSRLRIDLASAAQLPLLETPAARYRVARKARPTSQAEAFRHDGQLPLFGATFSARRATACATAETRVAVGE